MKSESRLFEDMFVLELANNHLGSLERALAIIADYSKIVRFNGAKAAIKLQFRDVENFIHKDFRDRKDIRYIKKTIETNLPKESLASMVHAIVSGGCIPMATPFDERSVDLCVELGIKIIKIASSDLNDWMLIEKIAKTRLPVIASAGGSNLKDIDDLVVFFANRNIPLAINHCVSLYPAEDYELELNQIEFLKNRYKDNVIGFSTHESGDLTASTFIAYAKGARTLERHIDIRTPNVVISQYCSLPEEVDAMMKAYKLAKTMCGGSGETKRVAGKREIEYLDTLVRGVYAKKDLTAGHALSDDDVYLAIPLQKGQLSCRELMRGEVLLRAIQKDEPLLIDAIDSPYATNGRLKEIIYHRGL